MPDAPSSAPVPWYKSEFFRWAVGILLGFALSWLSSHGVTPTPVTPPPGVLVLTVSPAPAAPPVSVTGK